MPRVVIRRGWRDRRGWPALLAAVVLALQMLIPGAALSANARDSLLVCTDHGLEYVPLSGGADETKHKHFGGLACEQCVIASLAAVTTTPVEVSTPAAGVRHTEPPPPAAPPPRTRAPPRPPSQGPPRNT